MLHAFRNNLYLTWLHFTSLHFTSLFSSLPFPPFLNVSSSTYIPSTYKQKTLISSKSTCIGTTCMCTGGTTKYSHKTSTCKIVLLITRTLLRLYSLIYNISEADIFRKTKLIHTHIYMYTHTHTHTHMYILCSIDRTPLYNLVNKSNSVHNSV